MAIAGLIVHSLPEQVQETARLLDAVPELTVFETREEGYVITVAEYPSDRMEAAVDRIKEMEGVLTVYTTYLTIEDELIPDELIKDESADV